MNPQPPAFGQSDIVRLGDEDAAIAVLERAVTGLWNAVNELTRLRRTKRDNYRVTIFGSARIQPGTPPYERVKELAAGLTEMGCDIISGGGPGLMQAANEGALSSISDTSWVANSASGAALYSSPGVGLAGKLATGALEGSNVDITSELVGLMTSQRNYQANSKVLTTENQMMQALMQAL